MASRIPTSSSKLVRLFIAGVVLQIIVIAGVVVLLTRGGEESGGSASSPAAAAVPSTDVFDSQRAMELLRWQGELGSRPAGSEASRVLARWARERLPSGSIEPMAGGLANVVGTIPAQAGGEGEVVLVGAHYDTKDMPGFVGANDGASGVAVVLELARVLAEADRPPGSPELRFVLFDGEESPDDSLRFDQAGLRGSRAYAERHADALDAAVIVDMVGDRDLSIPREKSSDEELWARLRQAAQRAGVASAFPDETVGTIQDDHTPFLRAGVPAIDVIDFTFDCWHRTCDDLGSVSEESLDRAGEALAQMLLRWR